MQEHLQSNQVWQAFLETLNTEITDTPPDEEKLLELLNSAIASTIQSDSALLFSGGIDSTSIAFIAQQQKKSLPCFVASYKQSKDSQGAERVGAFYDFHLVLVTISLENLENYLKKIKEITGRSDVVTLSVGAVMFAAAKKAKRMGCTHLISGLGSEELFAGYHRHEEALEKGYEQVHQECIEGLKGIWEKDISRDQQIAQHFGLSISFPFLDKELVQYATSIHPKHKISKEQDKIILRKAMEKSGLDKEFTYRKKAAAQYGSAMMKAIERLTKDRGFSYKKEYLEQL